MRGMSGVAKAGAGEVRQAVPSRQCTRPPEMSEKEAGRQAEKARQWKVQKEVCSAVEQDRVCCFMQER